MKIGEGEQSRGEGSCGSRANQRRIGSERREEVRSGERHG